MRHVDLSESSSAFLIGRDLSVTNFGNNLTPVKLKSSKVSRSQLLLKEEGGEWWAQDLGATSRIETFTSPLKKLARSASKFMKN